MTSSRTTLIAVSAVAAMAGCVTPPAARHSNDTDSEISASTPTRDSGEEIPDAPTAPPSNVIDAVLLPMFLSAGLPVQVEDDAVLCRRMAIDLTGIAPTQAEFGQYCQRQTPLAMATYFMNKPAGVNAPDGSPPYVFVNRRWWADNFQYQVGVPAFTDTFYLFIQQLDSLVGQLYAGTLMYDEFARKALASPAFARRFGIFEANHDLVQIASQAFSIFMGRVALPNEAEDFGNLWRAWNTTYIGEGAAVAEFGSLCPSVVFTGQTQNSGCIYYAPFLDPAQCAGVTVAGCQSTVLGPGEVVPAVSTSISKASLDAMNQAMLETPGKLISARPEFAPAAVTAALSKYLGWWDVGLYRPDYEVPAARDALAQKFVADGFDVRKMELEIVTSVLYTQKASLQTGETPLDPLWAVGPTKPLYAEAWLDTIGQALGLQLGTCDFRYGSANEPTPGEFSAPVTKGISFSYGGTARQLGGCPIAASHGNPSGLVPSIAKRTALATLCASAFKPAANATFGDILAQVSAGFGRALTVDEIDTVLSHMGVVSDDGCASASATSCNVQAMTNYLCTSLYATASFNYY